MAPPKPEAPNPKKKAWADLLKHKDGKAAPTTALDLETAISNDLIGSGPEKKRSGMLKTNNQEKMNDGGEKQNDTDDAKPTKQPIEGPENQKPKGEESQKKQNPVVGEDTKKSGGAQVKGGNSKDTTQKEKQENVDKKAIGAAKLEKYMAATERKPSSDLEPKKLDPAVSLQKRPPWNAGAQERPPSPGKRPASPQKVLAPPPKRPVWVVPKETSQTQPADDSGKNALASNSEKSLVPGTEQKKPWSKKASWGSPNKQGSRQPQKKSDGEQEIKGTADVSQRGPSVAEVLEFPDDKNAGPRITPLHLKHKPKGIEEVEGNKAVGQIRNTAAERINNPKPAESGFTPVPVRVGPERKQGPRQGKTDDNPAEAKTAEQTVSPNGKKKKGWRKKKKPPGPEGSKPSVETGVQANFPSEAVGGIIQPVVQDYVTTQAYSEENIPRGRPRNIRSLSSGTQTEYFNSLSPTRGEALLSTEAVDPSLWKDYVFDIRIVPPYSTVYKQSSYKDRVVHELRRNFANDSFSVVTGFNIPIPPGGLPMPLVENMDVVRIHLTEAEVGYTAGYPGEKGFPDNAFNNFRRIYAVSKGKEIGIFDKWNDVLYFVDDNTKYCCLPSRWEARNWLAKELQRKKAELVNLKGFYADMEELHYRPPGVKATALMNALKISPSTLISFDDNDLVSEDRKGNPQASTEVQKHRDDSTNSNSQIDSKKGQPTDREQESIGGTCAVCNGSPVQQCVTGQEKTMVGGESYQEIKALTHQQSMKSSASEMNKGSETEKINGNIALTGSPNFTSSPVRCRVPSPSRKPFVYKDPPKVAVSAPQFLVRKLQRRNSFWLRKPPETEEIMFASFISLPDYHSGDYGEDGFMRYRSKSLDGKVEQDVPREPEQKSPSSSLRFESKSTGIENETDATPPKPETITKDSAKNIVMPITKSPPSLPPKPLFPLQIKSIRIPQQPAIVSPKGFEYGSRPSTGYSQASSGTNNSRQSGIHGQQTLTSGPSHNHSRNSSQSHRRIESWSTDSSLPNGGFSRPPRVNGVLVDLTSASSSVSVQSPRSQYAPTPPPPLPVPSGEYPHHGNHTPRLQPNGSQFLSQTQFIQQNNINYGNSYGAHGIIPALPYYLPQQQQPGPVVYYVPGTPQYYDPSPCIAQISVTPPTEPRAFRIKDKKNPKKNQHLVRSNSVFSPSPAQNLDRYEHAYINHLSETQAKIEIGRKLAEEKAEKSEAKKQAVTEDAVRTETPETIVQTEEVSKVAAEEEKTACRQFDVLATKAERREEEVVLANGQPPREVEEHKDEGIDSVEKDKAPLQEVKGPMNIEVECKELDTLEEEHRALLEAAKREEEAMKRRWEWESQKIKEESQRFEEEQKYRLNKLNEKKRKAEGKENNGSSSSSGGSSPGRRGDSTDEYKKVWAVSRGRKRGIFADHAEAQESVKNYKNSSFRTFKSLAEAEKWLKDQEVEEYLDKVVQIKQSETAPEPKAASSAKAFEPLPERPKGAGFWAVANGRTTGLFDSFEEVQESVHRYPGADHKKFNKVEDAIKWLESKGLSTTKISAMENIYGVDVTQEWYTGDFENRKTFPSFRTAASEEYWFRPYVMRQEYGAYAQKPQNTYPHWCLLAGTKNVEGLQDESVMITAEDVSGEEVTIVVKRPWYFQWLEQMGHDCVLAILYGRPHIADDGSCTIALTPSDIPYVYCFCNCTLDVIRNISGSVPTTTRRRDITGICDNCDEPCHLNYICPDCKVAAYCSKKCYLDARQNDHDAILCHHTSTFSVLFDIDWTNADKVVGSLNFGDVHKNVFFRGGDVKQYG